MSIRVMKWAWHQAIPPGPKLVLMALADLADDTGACWPSVSTMAKQCSMSTRTVQRALQELIGAGLLNRDLRYRSDGSTTSNLYQLNVAGDDNLSEAPVVSVTGERHPCQGGGDMGDTPGSTTRSPIDPSPQTGVAAKTSDQVRGRDLNRFQFPTGLSMADREEEVRAMARLPASLAQQLLNELATRMAAGQIKKSPMSYLVGLIARANRGTFEPTVGRTSRRERPSTRNDGQAIPPRPGESERPAAPIYPDIDTNPLCQRVADVQEKAIERQRHSGESASAPVLENDSSPVGSPASTFDTPERTRVRFPKLRGVIGN